MTVRGALRTMSAEELLDWIERRRISAVLNVEWSSLIRNFIFDSGDLKEASSNEPSEHVGQLLIRAGLLDEVTVARALESQAASGLPFSRVIISGGGVGEADIRNVLESQAREAICDAMAWTEGSFVIDRTVDGAAQVELPLSVPLRPCIEEGQRRTERWIEIYERIPSEDAVMQIVARERLVTADDTAQDRRELEEIAEAVERGLTVGQIVLERYHQRFVALHRLTQLIERGVAELPGAAKPAESMAEAVQAAAARGSASDQHDGVGTRESGRSLALAARGRADAQDIYGAFDLAGQALTVQPDDADIQALYNECERILFAQLCRDLLTSFRIPTLLVDRDELETLDMSDSERYLAKRVDGRWDLLSLMRVSPLREAEALITFKRLADRGIIAL